MAGSPHGWLQATRAWLEGLPAEIQGMVAREARVHVARRDRSRLVALLIERYRENPFVRVVLERWMLKSHDALLGQARDFNGPPDPDGVEFLRKLQEENHLDAAVMVWLVEMCGNPALAAAGPAAFPSRWPEVSVGLSELVPSGDPGPDPSIKTLHKQLREKDEEIRRLQAALARQQRDTAGLVHRLEQAQRKVAEEAARRQELLADLERERQSVQEKGQQQLTRQQEIMSSLQKERQLLQAEAQASGRLAREREELLQDTARRLRRVRLEALRYRVQFLTLEAYLDVTSPRRVAMPPEAFMAYGELLDRTEAELLQRFRPDMARELAQRFAELQIARTVHRTLSQSAPLLPECTAVEPACTEAAGPLVREIEGGRERFYVRLPDRYQPVDITAVTAIGAFPGDIVAVEPRCEQQPGGAHFYLFFHLREARPRVEEIATLLSGGPPWLADTTRGSLLVMGIGDRRVEPGNPVVVAYSEDNHECGCLLLRVLPYSGTPTRLLPARRIDCTRDSESDAESLARRRLPLLEGRVIYILGGEGFETHYRHVVEGYGGRLIWTSGFSELRQIVHRVRQADAVVLVTRGVSHKAYDHLQSALLSTRRPLFYCNALGQSQLERVLENEVIPTLVPYAAQH